MVKLLSKMFLGLIFWVLFIYIVLTVPYPEKLSQASSWQVIYFFLPLFLALTFSLNLFTKFLPLSVSITLGLVIILILKALSILNIVTAVLVVLSVYLFASYFLKIKSKTKANTNLTSRSNIPKLRLHKVKILRLFKRNHG